MFGCDTPDGSAGLGKAACGPIHASLFGTEGVVFATDGIPNPVKAFTGLCFHRVPGVDRFVGREQKGFDRQWPV